MSSALAIINEAVDPKRFMFDRRRNDVTSWLKDNFFWNPATPQRFAYQADIFDMRAKIWVTLYERSVWLRFVVLTSYAIGSPIWKVWEINPRLEPTNHPAVVKVLSYVTNGVKRLITAHQADDVVADYTTKTGFKRAVDALFNQAEAMEHELLNR